jgi:hypothetical protein
VASEGGAGGIVRDGHLVGPFVWAEERRRHRERKPGGAARKGSRRAPTDRGPPRQPRPPALAMLRADSCRARLVEGANWSFVRGRVPRASEDSSRDADISLRLGPSFFSRLGFAHGSSRVTSAPRPAKCRGAGSKRVTGTAPPLSSARHSACFAPIRREARTASAARDASIRGAEGTTARGRYRAPSSDMGRGRRDGRAERGSTQDLNLRRNPRTNRDPRTKAASAGRFDRRGAGNC